MTQPRQPRARRRTGGQEAGHPIVTPSSGLPPNTGPLASAAWLLACELAPSPARWHVEVLLGTTDTVDDSASTLLRIELYSEEWGYFFRHDGRASWIRVTDLPFVHGRDDHGLLPHTPALKTFGALIRTIESRFEISFVPRAATIRSSLLGANEAVRRWMDSW